jgi:4,4'-diaponeurosporenoate glycosyltransferase
VVASQPLPDGWRGKTWACHQGAQAATGDWLLFLDADTWFKPDGLARVLTEFSELSGDSPSLSRGAGSAAVVEDPAAAVSTAASAAADAAHTAAPQSEAPLSRECAGYALSVAPHHEVRRFHEQFSAFFNLVMLAGTGAFTARGDSLTPHGLLGQFLLIDRAAYERVGGHEAVKGRILENFWLAEQLHGAGVPLRCRTGRGVLAFRMYPNGWRELIEGWTKGFAGGASQTPPVILWLVVLWMIGLMLAPLAVVLGTFQWPGLVTCALCAGQVGWMLRQVGSFHWLTALLYPAPLVFYFVVFTRSVWRAKRGQDVEWKGRQIRAG